MSHYIEHLAHGRGELTVQVRWGHVRLIVNLDKSPCPDATKNQLIEKYTAACFSGDDNDEEFDAQGEILDVIAAAGASILDEIASIHPEAN
ncbi:hypothetical protein QQX98_003964 [Neonectria punicea]|uniref:Uncharacterized protein n=1 Tax=Neonectria punicea TaxID=979145 RepID=A0ABR1HD38_9HYPO